jgi:hypothetical protein
MKLLFTLIISVCFLSTLKSQSKVEISDFEILNNSNWTGTLFYRNYSDDKEVTLKATLQISLKRNTITTKIKFPGEPKANSEDKIKLRKNGTYFGNEKIIIKEILEDGTIKIITVYEGKDNNRKASIYNTYLFNEKMFVITKEIQYMSTEDKFIRNKQTYKRVQNK